MLLKSIKVKTDASTFHLSKSNYTAARQNSMRLRAKFLKNKLLDSFNN